MRQAFARAVLGILAFTAVSSHAPGAFSQDAASFYKSHVVRFLAGGGYDNYARLLAPHLGAALGTTVVVDNQPAAGGLVALNYLYAGENDGTQFIIMNGGGAVMSQLFGLPTVQYDLAKANFLATVSSSPWLVLADAKASLKDMAGLAGKGDLLRWPATGPIDGLSDGASMICEAYDLKCRVVLGYKSSSEGALAVARGEMDALYVSDTSANSYIKAGQNKAIAVISKQRTRFFPDVPTVFDAGGLSEKQQWWLSARADIDALGRIVIAGPRIPPDRLAFLQEAFRKVLTDPAMRAEGDRLERYVDFEDGSVTKARALGVINGVTGDRKAQLKDVVMRKYLPGAQ